MSHFILAVVTNEDEEKDLEDLMSPYEEKEVPRFIKFTKEQAIADQRYKIEEYKNGFTYQEYLKDPEKYVANCKNEGHINYITVDFPKRLTWTDEECYAEALRFIEDGNVGENGEVYSTYNPKSKWDYYSVGGRWECCIPLKQVDPVVRIMSNGVRYVEKDYEFVDSAKVSEIAFDRLPSKTEVNDLLKKWVEAENAPDLRRCYDVAYGTFENFVKDKTRLLTYAALTPDGEWHEPGKMGWWGMSHASAEDEKTFNENFYKNYCDPYIEGNYVMTMVDCHI